jgi:FkbM family methyltransferase
MLQRVIHLARYVKKCWLWPFEPEIRLVSRFIERGSATIDIGANTGLYTEELGRRSAAVYAFEPDAKCFEYLRTVRTSNWHLENLAASDYSGASILRTPIINSQPAVGYGTLSKKNEFYLTEHEGVHVQDVVAVSLDDYFAQFDAGKHRISFIKIDVEGFEFNVVKGAVKLMQKHKPVLLIECEFRHSDEVPAMFEFFGREGYVAARFDPTVRGKLRAVSSEELRNSQTADRLSLKLLNRDNRYINNVFFLPAEKSGYAANLTSAA